MTAATARQDDLPRWILSAAVVLAVHLAGGFLLARHQEPLVGDDALAIVAVDLSAYTNPPSESQEDIAPGPLQQQFQPPPEPQPPKPEEKPEAKIEPQVEAPNPDVTLPPEPVKQPDKPKEEPAPPVPVTTAPPPPRPSAAQITSWHRQIALSIERHKGYPAAAQARHETGIAQVTFAIDRRGKVVTHKIARSSGSAALDQETIDTLRRAQPFPPPPPNMPGETFEFTVPIRFKVR
jgi:protein TonB